MGDPACWLDEICDGCGKIDPPVDEVGRCLVCADHTSDDYDGSLGA